MTVGKIASWVSVEIQQPGEVMSYGGSGDARLLARGGRHSNLHWGGLHATGDEALIVPSSLALRIPKRDQLRIFFFVNGFEFF